MNEWVLIIGGVAGLCTFAFWQIILDGLRREIKHDAT